MSAVPRTLIRGTISSTHRRHFVSQQTTILGCVKCVSKPPTIGQRVHEKQFHLPRNIPLFQFAEITSLPKRFPIRTEHRVTAQASKVIPMMNSKHDPKDTAYDFSKSKPLLRRSLGGLEIMYHHSFSNGSDIGWILFKVNTVFPVSATMVKEALYFLAEKLPLLRMTIQCNANGFYFLENDDVKLDFSEFNRADWLQVISEEVSVPFDVLNGPLWKCKLLKAEPPDEQGSKQGGHVVVSDDFVHESTFLFVLHHSVMDGIYGVSFISKFVDVLNNISLSALNTHTHPVVPLLPPIEDILLCPPDHNTSKNSALRSYLSISANFSDPPTKALGHYNLRFSREIQDLLSEQPRNCYLLHEFTRQQTSQMLRSCKDLGVSSTGVFVAACVQAFIDLVYPSSSLQNRIIIPVEFMVDLRRFCPKDISKGAILCLPGVASAPIPMTADIEFSHRPMTNNELWEMSRSFGNSISKEINSPETFKQTLNMINESKKLITAETTNGKSPYVLCISNMGCLDGLVTGDITKRARLTEIHGHSSILIEDSPIFYICFYSRSGKLYVDISFCENYTSMKTTQEYMSYLKEYIQTPPTNSKY